MKRPLRIGVDFGGVIAGKVPDGEPPAPVDGAFDALRSLVDRFDGQVWIVSKASEATELATRRWLSDHRFHEVTGIPHANLLFVRDRTDKRSVCEHLGIDLFIDDLEKNLEMLVGAVEHPILFGGSSGRFESVADWQEAERLVRGLAGD